MSLRNNKTPLQVIVAIPVTLIVLGAFAISVAAVIENLHFIHATNQILDIVSSVRTMATSQPGFVQSQGEDIWSDLEHVGQIPPSTSHANPWGGGLRPVSVSNKAIRIESELPTHDCRRLALYFLDHQPVDLGLTTIEAQSINDTSWLTIYPTQTLRDRMTKIACGKSVYARLALIFKIR